jgi:methoxymalonate biosynthesis acyl carrier protein
MSAAETKSKIREFLSRFLRNHEPGDDEDIFALGLVNSLFAMQLVTFVETEFGVTVGEEDLEIENFSTINAIAALVGRKTGAASGA